MNILDTFAELDKIYEARQAAPRRVKMLPMYVILDLEADEWILDDDVPEWETPKVFGSYDAAKKYVDEVLMVNKEGNWEDIYEIVGSPGSYYK